MTVPAIWANVADWQRMVARDLNSLTQGYPFLQADAAPGSPEAGFAYYDTALGYARLWDGSAWVDMYAPTVPSVPTLTAGTYTPTLTNVANLDGSTAYSCQYMRVDTVVTVSGQVEVNPTLAATSTQLGISLPVASNLANANECAGSAGASGVAGQVAAIRGDATNNRAELVFTAGDVTNQPMFFTFAYRVI